MIITVSDDNIVDNFHGTIIMGPVRYDYHGLTIISQPYRKHIKGFKKIFVNTVPFVKWFRSAV